MAAIVKPLLALALVCMTTAVFAQTPRKPVTKPAIQKFKPPKLYTTLDGRADSVSLGAPEAVKLISMPLKITDDKKAVYTISSYQFMYKRKGVTEDDDLSGKVTPITSITTDLFKTTPLPELWRNIIAEQLKPGEELFFYDIIVKDATGRLMFAPTLKIKVSIL